MGYDTFVFDMDGTLVDTGDAIVASLQLMQQRAGLKQLDVPTLRRFLGPPLKDSMCRYYGVALEETDALTAVYRDCYFEVGIDMTVVFDHVEEFLLHIREKGGRCALASLKQAQLADAIVKRTGLDRLFDYICLNWENAVGDKAAMICTCLDKVGCTDKRRAVMFGDSPHDGRAAQKAGVDFVPLTCSDGFAPADSLVGLPHVFNAHTVEEMRDFIFGAI